MQRLLKKLQAKRVTARPKRGVIIEFTEDETKLMRKVMESGAAEYEQFLPFIRSQILIFIVSLFEFYIKDAIEYIYRKNLNLLKTDDKSITYEKLLSFTNIEDLQNYMIEKESFSSGFFSYSELSDYFLKKWKIDFSGSQLIEEDVEEIFLIRNILVHNKGKVNRIFLQRAPNSGYKIGEEIKVTEKMLFNAVTLLSIQVEHLDSCIVKKFS